MKSTLQSRRAVLSGAIAGLACGSLPAAFAQGASSDELRIAQPWEFKTLRPAEAGFTYTRAGIVETLVFCEPDGRIVPGLARSWSVSDDGRLWRFDLREARFHDGSPLTAEAAKASFERLLPQSLYLKRAGIAAIEVDGGALSFRLDKPFGPFLSYLVDASTPVLAPASFDAAGDVVALVGTGPFRAASIDLPRAMSLLRNDAYWGTKARFAKVRYDAIANGDTRSNIAAAGDADIVLNLTAPGVARAASGGMAIERIIIPRTHILMLNCAKPAFADVATRQALSLALDRAGIAASIMRNPALAATQHLPPTMADWFFADLPPLRRDVAAANALLDDAGWRRGGDGVRVKDGVRFAGTVRTFPNRPELPVIATAMQAQFKAIGFDLGISVGEWQAIYEGQKDGTLELGLSSRNFAVVPDPIAAIALDYAGDDPAPGGSGATNWRHAGIKRDVAAYFGEADDGRRVALRRSIAGTLHTELPVIPIVWYDQIIATNPRVAGFVNDPFEQRYMLERVGLRS